MEIWILFILNHNSIILNKIIIIHKKLNKFNNNKDKMNNNNNKRNLENNLYTKYKTFKLLFSIFHYKNFYNGNK